MPDKKWIAQRALFYVAAALITTLVLSVKDQSGIPQRLTADEMRPWLAGLVTFVAFTCWNWVSSTARKTLDFTRFWVMAFVLTFGLGIWYLSHFHVLTPVQVTDVLTGFCLGLLAGSLRVFYHLICDTRIEH